MSLMRVEKLENTEHGYNVTILGLGDPGREAVAAYPKRSNRECLYYLDTLTLCDDGQDYAKICAAVTRADVLFIIADMTRDYENTRRFAALHRGSCCEKKRTVAVNCGGNCMNSQLFDLTISLSDGTKAYRPIEMLVNDMHHGLVGTDLMDVDGIFRNMSKATYYETVYSTTGELGDMARQIRMQVKADHGKQETYYGILCCTMPTDGTIDDLEAAAMMMVDKAIIDGDLIMQADSAEEQNDGYYRLAIMIGRVDKQGDETNDACSDRTT